MCVLPNVWAKTLVTKEQNCWLNQWVEKKTKPPKVNKRSQMPWMSCTHKCQKFHGSVEGWGQTLHQTHLAKCCFVHKLIWTDEFNYSIFSARRKHHSTAIAPRRFIQQIADVQVENVSVITRWWQTHNSSSLTPANKLQTADQMMWACLSGLHALSMCVRQ